MKKNIPYILVAIVILAAVKAIVFIGTPIELAEIGKIKIAGILTFQSPYTGNEEKIAIVACNPSKVQPVEETIFIGINLHEIASDEVHLFYNTFQPAEDEFQIVKCWKVVSTNDTKIIQSLTNMTMLELSNRHINVTSNTAYE